MSRLKELIFSKKIEQPFFSTFILFLDKFHRWAGRGRTKWRWRRESRPRGDHGRRRTRRRRRGGRSYQRRRLIPRQPLTPSLLLRESSRDCNILLILNYFIYAFNFARIVWPHQSKPFFIIVIIWLIKFFEFRITKDQLGKLDFFSKAEWHETNPIGN